MEGQEEDDDLKLAKASAGLLSNLEGDLPKVLWKAKSKPGRRQAHSQVKSRDLDRIISYIEPFQGEPQLLDAKLKTILPPIVDAYLDSLQQKKTKDHINVDFQTAVCKLLYTICKVRGYKIITGFLNNEPRYLEPILEAIEQIITKTEEVQWQVPYVLLLWLSHLLLTPFDLHSISTLPGPTFPGDEDSSLMQDLPPLISRILRVGLKYLHTPTKAQDAAASMLVRLSTRPDVQKFHLADSLITDRLPKLSSAASSMPNMYEMLGSLRFVAGLASSTELSHLIPKIYATCSATFDENDSSTLSSNAVAKKLIVKIFRNIAILSLRSAVTEGPLLSFLQTTDVLENVIDYLLRSLGDKDTPVRYAAAKALSLIVLELEPEMAHEVIQALLDSFKEDMPRYAHSADFTTANPLKWHGLTLALSHTLFKRSASPAQLPDILNALISALQFQQRTATGSTLGTNVRDAANFGIWSLARRYTTAELLPVKANILGDASGISVVQLLANQLILSACLDPAGNIRRGSSAAFQELVGRHPDQVFEGIALVQIVDYQAVSLRGRAMVGVANSAAGFHGMYWQNTLEGLFGWRGLGSADVPSRESAAASIANLEASPPANGSVDVLQRTRDALQSCPIQEVETLHGLMLVAGNILEHNTTLETSSHLATDLPQLLTLFTHLEPTLKDFHSRLLRSELPASIARFIAAICKTLLLVLHEKASFAATIPFETIDKLVDKLLSRHEDTILQVVPDLATALPRLKQAANMPLGCISAESLSQKVSIDASKSAMHGAGRAIALGALVSHFSPSSSEAVSTLCALISAPNVDWRVIGARALQLLLSNTHTPQIIRGETAQMICDAVHKGLNDYTLDSRGDIGSLVRLECIVCAGTILSTPKTDRWWTEEMVEVLEADIIRLSLEKLDRVRLAAAKCRATRLDLRHLSLPDIGSVSSLSYFREALRPLAEEDAPEWKLRALLEGLTSCAGAGAENLIQPSREVLASYLDSMDVEQLQRVMALYADILRGFLPTPSSPTQANQSQASLELLAFILDTGIPLRLRFPPSSSSTGFKWRNLLSTVQKAHYRSTDIPKLLSAVHCYYGLAQVEEIREEVVRKLAGMLRTNPYPRVRVEVAGVLLMVSGEEGLKGRDWGKPVAQNAAIVAGMQERLC